MYKTINRYITRTIAIKFLLLIVAMLFIVAAVDFMELMRAHYSRQNGALYLAYFAIFRLPIFLPKLLNISLVAAILLTYIQLNNNAELAVIKCTGYSNRRIAAPALFIGFITGCVHLFILNPAETASRNYSDKIMSVLNQNKSNGANFNEIWLRQSNNERLGGSIVIASSSIDIKKIYLIKSKFFFFNQDNLLYKRIDSDGAHLVEKKWFIKNAKIYNIKDAIKVTDKIEDITIETHLTKELIMNQISRTSNSGIDFDLVSKSSFWTIHELLHQLQISGLGEARRAEAYLNSLILLPLIYITLAIIAFLIASATKMRNARYLALLITGLLVSFSINFILELCTSLASSGTLSFLNASWGSVLIILLGSELLFLRHES